MSYIESPIGTGRLLPGAVTAAKLGTDLGGAGHPSGVKPSIMMYGGHHYEYANVAVTDGNIVKSEEVGAGNFESGAQSLKVQTAASQTNKQVRITLAAAKSVRCIAIRMKLVGIANMDELDVRIYATGKYPNHYYHLSAYYQSGGNDIDLAALSGQEGVWYTLYIPFSALIAVGTPGTWSSASPQFAVTDIVLDFTTNAGGVVDCYIDRITAPEQDKASLIICADGCYTSARDLIFPACAARGWPVSGRVRVQNVGGGTIHPTWAQLQALYAANPRAEFGIHGCAASAFATNSSEHDIRVALETNLALLRAAGIERGNQFISWLQNNGYADSGVYQDTICRSLGLLGGRTWCQTATYRPGVTPPWYVSMGNHSDIVPSLGPFNVRYQLQSSTTMAASLVTLANMVAGRGFAALYIHQILDTVVDPTADISTAEWAALLALLDGYVAAGTLEIVGFTDWWQKTYGNPGDIYVDQTTNCWKSRSTGAVMPW